MYTVSKMRTPAIPRWFSKKWLFGFFIFVKQLASQNNFLVKSELSLTTYLFLVSINQHHYNHDRFSKILRSFCRSRNWWIIIVFFQTTVSSLRYFIKKYGDLLQPFSCDHISKILRIFYASQKSWIIVLFLQHML